MTTSKCKEIFALLSEYLNLELPPDACKAIDEHLAGCPPCIEFAESLRSTIALCQEYRPSEMPAPLSEDARTRLSRAWRNMVAARGRP
jgi:predicted anti-sigma-YlaC factor YlaD